MEIVHALPPRFRVASAMMLIIASLIFTGCAHRTSVFDQYLTAAPSHDETSKQAYWFKDSNLDRGAPGGDATWAIDVIRAEARAVDRNVGDEEPPAVGVTVLAELRSSKSSVPLSGMTNKNGVVAWTLEEPTVETNLFLVDIVGQGLSWAEDDRVFYSTRPVLEHPGGIVPEQQPQPPHNAL